MILTYSPRSGHVKRDGAVIGRIEATPGGFSYYPFTWGRGSRVLFDAALPGLLAAVRAGLERAAAPGPTPATPPKRGPGPRN